MAARQLPPAASVEHRLFEGFVVAVHVVAEIDGTVFVGPGREIHNEDWQFFLERNPLLLSRRDGLIDAFGGPLGLVAQQVEG